MIFGALLMMGSGGVIVGGRLLIGQATSGVTQQNLLGDAGVAQGKASSIDGAINLLLIGLDARPNTQEDLIRSDTIVILHVPKSHDQAFLVSLPRDTRVQIPAYGKTGYRGGTDKINAAFAFGYQGKGTEEEKRARGTELLAMTIQKLIPGIQFNGAAIIDFTGFEAVLRELGKVHMCVDRRAQAIHLAKDKTGKVIGVWYDDASGRVRGIPPGGSPLIYEPGCYDMAPEVALEYSRLRKGECCPQGDYDRQRHQQQLLKAIAKEATSAGVIKDPIKLNRVIQAAGKAFILDTQGVPIENFLFTLKSVTANDLILVKTNGGKVNTLPGTTEELLTGESLQMLAAVRDGKLLDFLGTHTAFIGQS
jgi:LCP family protein required for cell wall assembly